MNESTENAEMTAGARGVITVFFILFAYLSIVMGLCYAAAMAAVMSIAWTNAAITSELISWVALFSCLLVGVTDMSLAFNGRWSPATFILAGLILPIRLFFATWKKSPNMIVNLAAEADRVKRALSFVAPKKIRPI